MDLAGTLTVFITRFLGLFFEAAPFLLLGTITSGLLEAFVSHDDLIRFIPRNPILASIAGSVMGFVFPVGECGVVPVTRRLYRKGLPIPACIAFLLAAPVINPVVIAGTYVVFHEHAIAIVYLRPVVTLVIAISIGILFSFQSHPERLLRECVSTASHPLAVPGTLSLASSLVTADSAPEPDHPAETTPVQRTALLPGLRIALALAAKEFFEMSRYLVLGALLATSVRLLVTQHQLEALATSPVKAALIMQALAFILSPGSARDAWVARGFINTFSPGSILGFLTFGPMVDFKNTLLFLGVFRKRVVLYLVLLPLLMTALVAIGINLNVKWL